jgi:hypothetical protein
MVKSNVKRNEVAKMKKIMLLTVMMVFALAVGSAYADESATWALTQSGNGITVFGAGPAEFDNLPLAAGEMSSSYEEGSAAGGWREEEEALVVTEPYNGITIFIAGPVDFETTLGTVVMIGAYEEGSAAGGLHEEEAALAPENGITIFSDRPVDYESVPSGTGW